MEASILLSETLKELRYKRRRIIHQGGQYSGKTVNILGALATLASEDETPTVTTVTSMSFPHLKGGALRDFEMYVLPTFQTAIKQYHKTDHIFSFRSGSIIEFKVFDTEWAARGQKRQRLFVNEANKFPYMTWFQLDSRSDQSIIDYNPTIRFWAHEHLIGQDGNRTIYSDHRHNPFLTAEKHREIESIKDRELFKVYARGVTGNVMGVIFPHWEMIDDLDFPEDDGKEIFCIDFGYTNDPTAIMKIHKIAGTLFVKELAYECGIPPKEIAMILKANGCTDQSKLWCEHDPDMIRSIRMAGYRNAMPARKGQGSVNAGIELLKTYNVRYTCSSRNLHRERGLYIWTTEKDTGRLTNIPIDMNNHTFDAIRYGAYSTYLRAA